MKPVHTLTVELCLDCTLELCTQRSKLFGFYFHLFARKLQPFFFIVAFFSNLGYICIYKQTCSHVSLITIQLLNIYQHSNQICVKYALIMTLGWVHAYALAQSVTMVTPTLDMHARTLGRWDSGLNVYTLVWSVSLSSRRISVKQADVWTRHLHTVRSHRWLYHMTSYISNAVLWNEVMESSDADERLSSMWCTVQVWTIPFGSCII